MWITNWFVLHEFLVQPEMSAIVQNAWGPLEIPVQSCLCRAYLNGIGHHTGERMALWKMGSKTILYKSNQLPHLTGHNESAVHLHTGGAQFSHERRGSNMDIECKVH